MAITVTASIFTATTAHAVLMPATIAASDLLVTEFSSGSTGTVTTPANWNVLHSTKHSASDVRLSSYYKIAVGNEDGTTVDFVTSIATKAVAHVYLVPVAEWHGTTPPEVGTASEGAGLTTADPPNVAPSWGSATNNIWLAVVATLGLRTVSTYPTNYTDGNDDNAATGGTVVSLGSAQRLLTASSEDPGVFTWDSAVTYVAQTVAIRPAAGGTSHTRTVTSSIISTLVD